jgi:uncharacterized protein (TIGR02001 family)
MRKRLAACLVCGAALLPLATDAQAQGAPSIGLGGHGLVASERPASFNERAAPAFEFSARAGLASDYIYRGVTLSDRKAAIGAGFEATFAGFYAGATFASVKLPTQPSGEISMTGGYRRSLGKVDLDLGVTYFLYPGETAGGPTNGIDYWETALRAETKLADNIRAAGGFAYSPNISNTGAWGWYAAAGLGVDVPASRLPADLGVSFSAAAGYSWFGNQYASLGGFALPAYLNWHAGVTFSHKVFNLDLRYHDTNLTKENCYVFTGDPNARPGGRPDPVTNPDGLTSRWCSAAFVAKLWFELNGP